MVVIAGILLVMMIIGMGVKGASSQILKLMAICLAVCILIGLTNDTGGIDFKMLNNLFMM